MHASRRPDAVAGSNHVDRNMGRGLGKCKGIGAKGLVRLCRRRGLVYDLAPPDVVVAS